MSYIEETPKHHHLLVDAAIQGVLNGIESAKKEGLYITYARGSQIVREYPNGEIKVIGHLDATSKTLPQNAKLTLS